MTIYLKTLFSVQCLIGYRIIESATYCYQIVLAQLHKNSTQNTSVNCIIRILLSLFCRPKVILLSGGLLGQISENVSHKLS
jgi:hypothetical protein